MRGTHISTRVSTQFADSLIWRPLFGGPDLEAHPPTLLEGWTLFELFPSLLWANETQWTQTRGTRKTDGGTISTIHTVDGDPQCSFVSTKGSGSVDEKGKSSDPCSRAFVAVPFPFCSRILLRKLPTAGKVIFEQRMRLQSTLRVCCCGQRTIFPGPGLCPVFFAGCNWRARFPGFWAVAWFGPC